MVFRREDRLGGGAAGRSCRSELSTTTALALIVAIFGTTISPYLFFWQSSQEVEENDDDPEAAAEGASGPGARRAAAHRLGDLAGMAFSNLIAIFDHAGDRRNLERQGPDRDRDLRQAAEALRPSPARRLSSCSPGLIGTGLLAVPVLAGSAAYAMAEREAGARAWS